MLKLIEVVFMDISERKKQILKTIIDDYISTAEPVGSKSISERWKNAISPATIRNEMSELEHMGLIDKPHTSAGRIPSPYGYRVYVDELMKIHEITKDEMDMLNRALNFKMQEIDRLLTSAGKLISELTNYTAIAVSPRGSKVKIRRIDIISMDCFSFVLVLVTGGGIVKNKLVRTFEPVSDKDAQKLGAVLCKFFADMPLCEISPEHFSKVRSLSDAAAPLLSPVFEFLSDVANEMQQCDVFLLGASRLLRHPEYRDPEKAQLLLDYLSDPENIVKLTNTSPVPDHAVVSIGPENGVEILNDASLVYTSYHGGENANGIIGLIGPTRMDYAKVVAKLNLFVNSLNRLLLENFPCNDDEYFHLE